MRELRLLLKIQLLRLFGVNKLRYMNDCPEKKKLRTNIILYLIVAVVMLPTIAMYFLGFASILAPQGEIDMLISLAVTISSLVVVLTSVLNAANNLFVFSDFDTTVSLPISLRTIALSRLLKLYGTNLFFTAFIMIPVLAAYATYANVTFGFALVYLVFVFIVPMLPVVISAFISVLFTKLTAKLQKKNTTKLIMSVLLTGVLALFVIFSGNMAENLDSIVLTLTSLVKNVYPMSIWLIEGLNGNILLLIAFAALNILPFTLFTILLGRLLKPMNAVLNSGNGSNEKLERKSIVSSSAFAALIKKDLGRFFTSIGCFMNVAIGYLLLLVGSLVLLFSGEDILKELYTMPGMESVIRQVAPFIACMVVGLTNPNAAIISLEGKSFWQLKSLPLSLNEIMRAKLSVGLITSMPVTLVSMILISIVLKASVIEASLLVLAPMSQALLSSVFSLKMNFEHPKFDWTNEMETVKQGTPILLTMLLGFVLPAIVMAVSLIVGDLSTVLCFIYIVASFVVSLLLWKSLSNKKAEMKFTAMN